MNKKKFAVAILAFCAATLAYAGGTYTNTNQSARFGRYMALEGSTSAADIAYYNPAGTIKLGEGFHFSFSNQSAFQKRKINSSFPLYKMDFNNLKNPNRYYEGKASAPIIPSVHGVYRKGKWALSGGIAIVGGGGKATFNDGLSLFEGMVGMGTMMLNRSDIPGLPAATAYNVEQYMTGSNFIYGGQIGGAYEVNEMFSVYGGFRLNIVNNSYKGNLQNLAYNVGPEGAMGSATPYFKGIQTKLEQDLAQVTDPETRAALMQQVQLSKLLGKAGADGAYLDSKQSGWGISPIIGANFSWNNLNIGAKYEFRTNLNVENKTNADDTGMFGHGVNTAHDIPALLAIGAEYKILPNLKAAFSYHHFFDRNADMGGKEKHISGTNEYLFGAEYNIDRMFTISTGAQITRYGIKDGFQSDLSFSVNSYSLGFGGAVKVSKNVNINVGYFYTAYSDYKKSTNMGTPTSPLMMDNSYTRTNKVFTAGVDFSF